MTSVHDKPGVAFWATVVLVVLLVGYPLSIGPVIWWHDRNTIPAWAEAPIEWFYSPLDWIAHQAPDPIRAPLFWYADFWRSKP